ncbi:MAG: hypothetical protein AAF805_15205 [Planctomycetota bacterium]
MRAATGFAAAANGSAAGSVGSESPPNSHADRFLSEPNKVVRFVEAGSRAGATGAGARLGNWAATVRTPPAGSGMTPCVWGPTSRDPDA